MLRLDMDTQPGGVRVHWRKGRGLSFHRKDGSLILTITATYADDRALNAAAKVLNFLFRGQYGTEQTRTADRATDTGDGGQA